MNGIIYLSQTHPRKLILLDHHLTVQIIAVGKETKTLTIISKDLNLIEKKGSGDAQVNSIHVIALSLHKCLFHIKFPKKQLFRCKCCQMLSKIYVPLN